MATSGEVAFRAELQNNRLCQRLRGHIIDIIVQVDEVPRGNLYQMIHDYSMSKINVEEL